MCSKRKGGNCQGKGGDWQGKGRERRKLAREGKGGEWKGILLVYIRCVVRVGSLELCIIGRAPG